MPVYDCGEPECDECRRAFGPDRTKAIENYKRRETFYATLEPKQQKVAAALKADAAREATP